MRGETMIKETFSLNEAETLQKQGYKVKSISGNPKKYVMENAEVKAEVKEIKEKKNDKK